MKVLITGVTARMIGSKRLKYNYLSNVSLIEKALVNAGHEVETRKVGIDETDIHQRYDVALVGMANIFSLGAGYFPEATQVLSKFDGRAALYADDWSFVGFGETIRGVIRGWTQYLKWRNYPHEKPVLENMEAVLRQMVLPGYYCPWQVLLPMFEWGDPEAFMDGNLVMGPDDICHFDPTELYGMEQMPRSEKHKQWILAALGNHEGWLRKIEIAWPVYKFGNRRLGQRVLPESDIIDLYKESYGVMAPRYPKAGTGWWRVRFVHAAECHNIMICAAEDAAKIGPSYQIAPHVVENMSNSELYDLAQAQYYDFKRHTVPSHLVVKRLDAFVQKLRIR